MPSNRIELSHFAIMLITLCNELSQKICLTSKISSMSSRVTVHDARCAHAAPCSYFIHREEPCRKASFCWQAKFMRRAILEFYGGELMQTFFGVCSPRSESCFRSPPVSFPRFGEVVRTVCRNLCKTLTALFWIGQSLWTNTHQPRKPCTN